MLCLWFLLCRSPVQVWVSQATAVSLSGMACCDVLRCALACCILQESCAAVGYMYPNLPYISLSAVLRRGVLCWAVLLLAVFCRSTVQQWVSQPPCCQSQSHGVMCCAVLCSQLPHSAGVLCSCGYPSLPVISLRGEQSVQAAAAAPSKSQWAAAAGWRGATGHTGSSRSTAAGYKCWGHGTGECGECL
jgi:hypothetical protein